MKRLFILYDADCALCRRIRVWLGRQPTYVPLSFVPLQSTEAQCRFPELKDLRPADQLVVISDEGQVWRGESAWIIILWAMREYREWSQRLAQPIFRPLAAKFCSAVSENRHSLSGWLKGATDGDLHARLAGQPLQADCDTTGYCKPR
jgi:predicted DCC family thiol-disulfide oxidoreductase YuxK